MRHLALFAAAMTVAAVTGGCAATRELAALSQVDFNYDRVSGAQIAGIALGGIDSYDDIGPLDLGRLALAIASKDVPFDLTVHLTALNPKTNDVNARMTALDWAYLVDGSEIVSGRLDQGYVFQPGVPSDVPVVVTVNLVRFFGSDGRALLETALVLAGQRASTKKVTMRLTPSIETPAGKISYALPINLDLSKVQPR